VPNTEEGFALIADMTVKRAAKACAEPFTPNFSGFK
jgi:hypothetical protein